MQLSCPNCGTRDARVSQRTSFGEYFKALVGIYPLRCRRCRTRWETSVWSSGDWRFARCPRCYRQELTTWSREYYFPPAMISLKLRLGATPYRCAACRCNFASFRACKEKFAWRHKTRVEVGTRPEIDMTPATASLRNLSSQVGNSFDAPPPASRLDHAISAGIADGEFSDATDAVLAQGPPAILSDER